jgi:TolB-like protein/class 3 adenylate cyclase/Tfp pilus assembly protein PilF
MSQSRQLAAIMFTDIVGYTALMGRDERKAFELLNKNRQIQKPIIEQYNGKWIKELGDGVIATFQTVSDAVMAAIKIQEACNVAKEFQLRIGIHQGEIVIEDNDVFGDAVNIASRIQTVAVPGSIYISEVVHHNISNKNDINTEFVKTENLKNVKEPVKIYRIKLDSDNTPSAYRPFKANKRRNLAFIFAGLVLVALAGYFIFKGSKKTNAGADIETVDKSIAVLPFENRSNDKEQEYFSDGLSEDLLNMLSKIPELKVIGRTSSFAFKGKNEDLRTIGRKLDVAHLLEGSVQKDGNKIRVTARLIKTSDGFEMWSANYDRDLKNIFDLQDEIAQNVVQQLKLKLLQVKKSGTGNIEAHNLILQGNYFYDKLDSGSVAKAVEFYYKALTIDSTDAVAWVCLTNAISRQSWQNYIDQSTGYEKARQTALKAIALNPNYALAYSELADIKQYYDFDWRGAEKNYQTALRLEPSNADVLNSFADVRHAQGHYGEAEQYHKKALEFNPLKPLIYMGLASDLSYQGKFAEAIPYFRKVLELDPKYQRAHLYIGRNYIMMGKPELALEEIQKENMEVFKNFGLAIIYFALSRKKEADEKLKEFIENYQDHWRYLIAQLYAFRNEKDKAFSWLDSAYDHRDSWLWWVKNDPWLKNIHDDPRYKAILKKMNLLGE